MAASCQWAVNREELAALADELGLSVTSLRRIFIGWSGEHRAWTFPMVDVADNVVGIQLRFPDGRNLAVRSGHEGLFIPGALDLGGQILIAEGPTDCAALLDLGFNAVGRPSCNGGKELLVGLIRKFQPTEIVIAADADAPGQRGADALAAILSAYCAAV